MRNKMMRGLFFLLLLVCLAGLGISASAETSGPWTYEIESGGLVITAYNGAESTVVIPDALDDYKVTIIGSKAFEGHYEIRTLTIPEGISAIRAEAFMGCAGLSTINFNAANCTVPDVWIYDSKKGNGIFSGAGSASASGLKVVFGARVKSIPAKLFDTGSVSEYGHTGAAYAYVTEVVIPSTVATVGARAFYHCPELTKVSFGSGLTQIGANAFCECDGLEEITLPDSLTFIDEKAFYGCSALKKVNWGKGMDTIGKNAFAECTSLQTADLPAPLSTIGIRAFANCSSLTRITIPATVTGIQGEAFLGTVKLQTINFNSGKCTIPDVWIYDDKKGSGVFSGAGSSSSAGLKVVFGQGVETVPAKLFDTASVSEYGHNGAAYAYVTGIEFSGSVKTIGARAFYNCQRIEEVTIGDHVAEIGASAFWGCLGLQSLEFDSALTKIGESAFSGCTALSSLSWGSGLDEIGKKAFYGCTSLKKLQLPSPLSTIGVQAFAECSGIETLVIPDSVTKIGAEAFIKTVKLNQITFNAGQCTIPEVWIYDGNKGAGVFSGAGSGSASGLTVTFGSSVSAVPRNLFETASLTEYGHKGYDFAYVTEVILPKNVDTINPYAFRTCEKLTKITIYNKNAVISDNSLPTGGTRTMYCYRDSSAEAWAQANGYTVAYLADPSVIGDVRVKVSGSTVTITGPAAAMAKTVTIPATVKFDGKSYKVTAIADGAFKGMKKLTKVTIGKNVATIGKNAFAQCVKLTAVSGGAAVKTIKDNAFNGCKVLKTFPALSKLQTIGANAFRGCVKITAFTLASGVKSIGKNAFYGCKALKTITVKTKKLTTSSVKASAFKGIHSKATVKCPSGKAKAYKSLFVKKGAAKTCKFK